MESNRTEAKQDCVYSHRCFMSGEYCSKHVNIQKERKRLHDSGKINAFVIMNFSNMSDVVYNWKIKPFIESLKKYLVLKGNQIICQTTPVEKIQDGEKAVKEINVIRADSNYASNYVVCNRVCQQMQIADLIIVDVSSENTNVFYEFGMAVAFGKLILPICYSESFFEMKIPATLTRNEEKTGIIGDFDKLKRHIDCYPWRRVLFEHYGIRYRSSDDCGPGKERDLPTTKNDDNWFVTSGKKQNTEVSGTHYLDFELACNQLHGFSDVQYSRFPYAELKLEQNKAIGEHIYTRLRSTYNNASYSHNTLIVYTLDGFLNEEQAGQCIVNYHKYIVLQMRKQNCFCGDRVGVLIQSNAIPEGVKDAQTEKHLLYNVGEVIHIGMNEATYVAHRETIKPKDFLSAINVSKHFPLSESVLEINNGGKDKVDPPWCARILIYAKNHIRNKSISIYPTTPIYVNRIKHKLQTDILDVALNDHLNYYYCLYHVMLKTLRYTNEIVVDISKNPLQSLFWLGAAHGANINAITVQHEESEQERTILTGSPYKKERAIFDVAGLWSAILQSHDVNGFYHQLALAQEGIEQHSKLMIKNLSQYETQLLDCFYKDSHDSGKSMHENSIDDLIDEKQEEEAYALESYYRDRFWKPMLRYERLRIYFPQIDGMDTETSEPKLHAVKWDVDAIANISQYLSKRKLVGEYSFRTLGIGENDSDALGSNFIVVGNGARPLVHENDDNAISLAQYIQSLPGYEKPKAGTGENLVRIHNSFTLDGSCGNNRMFKGFTWNEENKDFQLYTQTPQKVCVACMNPDFCDNVEETPWKNKDELQNSACILKDKKNTHVQLAQLVLWRELPKDKADKVLYWVSLIGASGPSTLALSSLFINGEDINAPQTSGFPLTALQRIIRGKIIHRYINALHDKLCNIVNLPNDLKKVPADKQKGIEQILQIEYAAELYLSSVLYRYFLPFLSLEDEETLYNGMQYFMASNFAAKTIQLASRQVSEELGLNVLLENDAVSCAVGSLRNVLSRLRGIEAIYRVDVETAQTDDNIDNRKVLKIKPLTGEGDLFTNCLFYESTTSRLDQATHK